ncbi:MAG: CDP-alcohol phosphatidyltransferase family protein [Candidatus Aminicenantes bacterium]|nr:CDP-alcohol phosphatidyltransferase family protein [Candidatus Aminicenantes bacterium]
MKLVEKPKENPYWLTLPNLLTLFRFLLIPFFLSELIKGEMFKAFLIFLLAGLTDLLDGWVARLWNLRTPLGRILDPAADKLLLVSAFLVTSISRFSHPYSMPPWLTAAVISRDTLIALGALVLFLWKRIKTFSPSLWGKISTFLQVLTVLFVLFANALAEKNYCHAGFIENIFSQKIQTYLFVLTFIATVISGIHYTTFGFKKGFFSH